MVTAVAARQFRQPWGGCHIDPVAIMGSPDRSVAATDLVVSVGCHADGVAVIKFSNRHVITLVKMES